MMYQYQLSTQNAIYQYVTARMKMKRWMLVIHAGDTSPLTTTHSVGDDLLFYRWAVDAECSTGTIIILRAVVAAFVRNPSSFSSSTLLYFPHHSNYPNGCHWQ